MKFFFARMGGRSLQASQEGIELAKKALLEMGLTQQRLADRLNVTRQPISKFFTGKSLSGDLFVEICKTLKLNWQEISTLYNSKENTQQQLTEPRRLELDQLSRNAALKAFSHLTLQEYSVAKEMIERSNYEPLLKNLAEKGWREIGLLTVRTLLNPNNLLQQMKQQVDSLLARDEKSQRFLVWVRQKSASVNVPIKTASIRDFYFALALNINPDLTHESIRNSTRNLALDLYLAFALDLALDLDLAFALDLALDLDCAVNFARELHAYELHHSLQKLHNRLPNTSWENQEDNQENFQQWWKENGQSWTEQLRTVTIEYRNIGHDWQFTDEQKALLQQYYDANKLLVDCLNSDCYVSREVRQEIEETLLLPISEIEKRSQ